MAVVRAKESLYAYIRTHHIVADAWGLHQFIEQVRSEYLTLAGMQTSNLLDSPNSHFVLANLDRGSETFKQDLSYFQGNLGGISPPLFTRKAPKGLRPTARYTTSIDRTLIQAIRHSGKSPFLLFTAAVAYYLGRIHSVPDVVVGIATQNRKSTSEKRAIGHFANTLPLRVKTQPDISPNEFLSTLRDDSRELIRHQRMPLGEIMQGQSLWFDTTISYMRWPDATSIDQVHQETVARTHAHDSDVLAIWLSEFGGNSDVQVDFEYACDVFDEDFPISATVHQIELLFQIFAKQEENTSIELPIISSAERDRLLYTQNATEAQFPDFTTLPALFLRQAIETPNNIAIVDPDGEAHSFADVRARAISVATLLQKMGVKADDRIAVVVERGRHLIPAILGVHLSGCAYVPMDPSHPAERMRALFEDCDAKLVLVGDAVGDLSSLGAGRPLVRLSEISENSTMENEPLVNPADLAYVIYTSGSTGRPKGVMIEHRAIMNRLWWMQRRYPITSQDVLLQKTPTSFDVSVWELFWWSFTGARLSVLQPGAEKDPRALLATVERDGVTIIHFVPSMLTPFLDLLETDTHSLAAAATLRLVFCSGEALSPSQVTRFNRIFAGRVRLVNLYGPTEAAVDVSFFDCTETAPTRIPIGKPIDNIQLYVLDKAMRVQPQGVPGELFIGGVGLARGYLNRPELNKDRFISNPFVEGGRLYRTGDIARWLADGNIEYLGRADDQVKVRGNRVEPDEVRDQIIALDGMRDAAVIAKDSDIRGKHLVAYFVADFDPSPTELREKLSHKLPDFMIPSFFMKVEKIPLTGSGKLDRRALPLPENAESFHPPRTDIEARLAAIWAEVLGLTIVGVFDDFYAVGGDSILMLRVRARAERHGMYFELEDLIRNPTIAALAEKTRTSDEADTQSSIAPFELVSDVDRPSLTHLEDAFPVSKLSLGLLYHSSEHPNSATYKDVFRYRFDLDWSEAAFETAVKTVIENYPSLRSSFDLASFSEPLQLVYPSFSAVPLIVDLRGEQNAEVTITEHVNSRQRYPYEIERPGLFQFAAFIHDSGFDVVLSFHHAILDGWSVATLIVRLLHTYKGRPSSFKSPRLSSYIKAERDAIRSPSAAYYWSELLKETPFTNVDGFAPNEPPNGQVTSLRLDIADSLVARVRNLASDRSVSVKSVFLAAHCLTLHCITRLQTIVTGVVTHGRPDLPEADKMVGLFLNTTPVKSSITQTKWGEFVETIFDQERSAYPHRRYPISEVVQRTQNGLSTAFNFVNMHVFDQVDGLIDFEVWEETNFSPLINVINDPAGRGYYLRIDFGSPDFSSAQAKLLAEQYVNILTRIVEKPEDPVDFAFLSSQVTLSPKDNSMPDVVSLFEKVVEVQSQSPAIIHAGGKWTYSNLESRSRAIGQQLIRNGAKPGDTVGIALSRSFDMLATIWGVLRAGMVCVPLDVSYPKPRLELIIGKANPSFIVVSDRHLGLVDQSKAILVERIDQARHDIPLPPAPDLDDLAVLLFTSGSTGEPKGVELSHRTWANYVKWQLAVPSGALGGRTLQFAPLSFDVSFGEIFSTLCGGGTLCLVSDEIRLDPIALLRLIDEADIERIMLPYVALQRVAEASNALDLRPNALRIVISSGEQLRITEEIRSFCSAFPDMILENQYGPTEAYVVSYHTLSGNPQSFPTLPPIGQPVEGADILLLDEKLRPVPTGVAAEIYIGGNSIAKGYHCSEQLTNERFLPSPFDENSRIYKTGDVGRKLPDGNIAWLGRADNQVKVRGFRIEPAEVELAILRHAEGRYELKEVAVVAQGHSSSDAVLVAFLVGDSRIVDLDALETALRGELPKHLIPSHLVWIDKFPLTPSGKRDDAALRKMSAFQVKSVSKVKPRNEIEQYLADLLTDLIDIPEVGIHDNFFEIGGTSLTAMRFVVSIEKNYGINVPIAALIETPTIEGLAKRLSSGPSSPTFSPLVPMRARGDRNPLFLIHPLGGHVLCYMPFVQATEEQQPVYALQAFGTERGNTPLTSVEDMAAKYTEAILAIRPTGPHAIAGWSFGGFVAYEIGRQLQELDTSNTPQVFMLDTIAMPHDREVTAGEDALIEFFYWELVWFERTKAIIEPLPKAWSTDQKLEHILFRAIENGILPIGTKIATIRRLYSLFRANWNALITYRPKPSLADVTLLRASGALPDALKPMHDAAGTLYDDPHNGWDRWVRGRLNVINVTGDHLNLMSEPQVSSVAAIISGLLRDPRIVRGANQL